MTLDSSQRQTCLGQGAASAPMPPPARAGFVARLGASVREAAGAMGLIRRRRRRTETALLPDDPYARYLEWSRKGE